MKSKRFMGVVLSVAMSIGGFQAAMADSQIRSLEAIQSVAPEVFGNQAKQRRSTQALVPGALFHSNDRGITLEVANLKFEKSVPFGGSNYRVLSGMDLIDYVPVPKSDGSVQTAAVLKSADAGEELLFKLRTPAGARASILETGEVIIVDAAGKMLAGISAPWAIDASGQEVSTWFELANGGLIQHVDHQSGNFVYPIVADPWLGIDLYGFPYVTEVQGKGYKINVTPTVWGMGTKGISTWFAHRDEVVTKLGSRSWRWTDTIQEPFYCHIAGLPASLPEFNMESWSPLVNWAHSLVAYKCNPHSGTWY